MDCQGHNTVGYQEAESRNSFSLLSEINRDTILSQSFGFETYILTETQCTLCKLDAMHLLWSSSWNQFTY